MALKKTAYAISLASGLVSNGWQQGTAASWNHRHRETSIWSDGEIDQETVSGFWKENGCHTGPITFKVVVSDFRTEAPCTWVWWNYQTLLMASLPLPWPPPALVEFWHFFVPCVVLMCFSISWSTFSGNCFQQEPLSVRCSGLSLATPFSYTQLHLRDHYPCLSEAPTG